MWVYGSGFPKSLNISKAMSKTYGIGLCTCAVPEHMIELEYEKNKSRKLLIKNKIQEIKTACLWKKKSSTFTPDFCPIRLENDPWIVQPTEHYEEISIEEIIEKQKKG